MARISNIGGGSPVAEVGGGGVFARTATLIVAASNSKDTTNADYVCDGVADQVQINQAITDLPSGGGRVVLLEGTYTCAAKVNINKANTTLEGQGKSTIVTIANSTNTDVINVNNVANCVVTNLKVDGNMANQTTAGDGISVTGSSSNNTIISNCLVQNTYANNISVENGLYQRVVNNYCDTTKTGVGGHNIHMFSDEDIVANNICFAADGTGINFATQRSVCVGNTVHSSVGMYIYAGSLEGIVANNHCEVTTSPTTAVIYANSVSINIKGNTISGNYTGSTAYTAIWADSSDQTVEGNVININTGTAIVTAIQSGGTGVSVRNNKIGLFTAVAHKGILQKGHENNIISGNHIFLTSVVASSVAIDLSGGTGMSSIFGNSAENFATFIDASNTYYIKIDGNHCESCNVGVSLSFGSNSIVSNNFLYGNSNGQGSGITASNTGSHLLISGNFIEGFGQYGIFLSAKDNCQILGNRIINISQQTDNGYDGILITGTSTYNVISGNQITNSAVNDQQYGIREASTNDGPNIITNNICLNAQTANISTQHASTDVSHNITA